uniref:E2F transcription factor CC-MB domain-containing protein n=1 Tax=Sander lucioperca TaxID=283035 RepID=A0A8D0DFL0_SANLU
MCVHRGGQMNVDLDQELKTLVEEERRLDELIHSCTRQVHQLITFAYLTYEDVQRIPSMREQTVIVIKAPAETKLEVPHPEESLQVHLSSTQGPIEVFLCSDDPIPMEATDSSVANGANSSHLDSPANGNSSTPLVSLALSTSHGLRKRQPTDQQSFVGLTPPLGFSLGGDEYLMSLAEDEGITDLFSSYDLEHLPLDMPLL